MDKQLRVVKANGNTEAYLHTKVIGTINHALTAGGGSDMPMAEDLAQVVTFYLYNKQKRTKVESSEIFSMIKAVLVATGHEQAALALSQHARQRSLARSRTEVLAIDVKEFDDARKLYQKQHRSSRALWNKAHIVHDLTTRFNIPYHTARAVASVVEERVLRMELTMVPLSLIKQLVLGETAAMLQAEEELHTP